MAQSLITLPPDGRRKEEIRMRKKYISPDFEVKQILISDNLCASEETPIIDVVETNNEDDLT